MTAQTPAFRVTVLGPFEVWRDGAALGAGSWQRSVQTLLKLLVTSPDRRKLRDEVIEILWPNAAAERAGSNSRYALRQLRLSLGGDEPPAILSERVWLTLNPAYRWEIDLVRFLDLARQASLSRDEMEEMAGLYRGEPLPEDRYEDWAAPLRTHIQQVWQESCRRFAATLQRHGELESAVTWLDRALETDPLDEESIKGVLQILIALGRRPEAIKRFRQFEEMVRSELDIEPAPQTRAILSQAAERQPVASARVPAPSIPEPVVNGKGLQQALPTGGYLGALPVTPLVARRGELARVLSLLNVAEHGSGPLVLLAGEPGVGKTRLAQEVTSALYERGFLVAAGRCYAPEQVVPYYPFLDVLAELYRLAPASVRGDLPRRWPHLARLLPELQETAPAAAARSPDAASQEEPLLIRSVAGFLHAVAETQPLAILLDDLHWSDSASVKLLLHLARHRGGNPLFLLGTYRDFEVTYGHPLHGAIVDLSREGLVEKISLARLLPEGTGALIAEALRDSELPAGLVEIVHGPTDGNPFFVQEVVRSMVEGGDLFRTGGRWERRARTEIAVPETVRSVVGQRLARLEEETQGVLFAASVLGQAFRFEEVQSVAGRDEGGVETALEEASRAGLVRETGPDVYAFSHALAQQAVYGEMMGRRRRRFHLLAAETLEAGADRERRAAEIATHFLEAGERERAIAYLLLAGKGAEEVFAHPEAERHYRLAAESAREIGATQREAVALERLAHVLSNQGKYAEAEACAERGLTLFRGMENRDGELSATVSLLGVLLEQGKARETQVLARAAIEASADMAPSLARAYLYRHEAMAQAILGDYVGSLPVIDEVERIGQALGDERLVRETRLQRLLTLRFLGQWGDTSTALRDALADAEERGDTEMLSDVLSIIGMSLMLQGRLQASRPYRERALAAARRMGNPARVVQALAYFTGTLFLLGEWKEARKHIEEAVEIGRAIDNADALAVALMDLGNLTVCEGEWERGEMYLQEALRLCEQTGSLTTMRFAHLYLAHLDRIRGNPQGIVDRLTPLLDQGEYEESFATPLLPLLVHGYLGIGEVDRAESIAADALRRTADQDNRIDWVFTLLAKAAVLEHRGRLDEARATLDEILLVSREMSLRVGETDALKSRARLEVRHGDRETARHFLTEAREAMLRMGAMRDVEELDGLLEELGSP